MKYTLIFWSLIFSLILSLPGFAQISSESYSAFQCKSLDQKKAIFFEQQKIGKNNSFDFIRIKDSKSSEEEVTLSGLSLFHLPKCSFYFFSLNPKADHFVFRIPLRKSLRPLELEYKNKLEGTYHQVTMNCELPQEIVALRSQCLKKPKVLKEKAKKKRSTPVIIPESIKKQSSPKNKGSKSFR
ncbi:MAG: hypothetical protein ACPGJV_01480 [Bacteriovoracaceae bacterium]